MSTNFLNINWIGRKLRYLFLNPKYFYLYFCGKPEKVLTTVTGIPESRFFELKKELDSNTDFIDDLNKESRNVLNVDFNLDQDHYFLYALVRTINPALIVETGVFHGHFTACFLKGLNDNYKDGSADGRLISIDLPAYETILDATHTIPLLTHLPMGREPGWIIPEYLRDRWQLLLGDSREILPSVIEKEKNISLFFHDSLHTYAHMKFEFETAYPALKMGAYMMTHDVHWNRSFSDFVNKHNQKEYVFHGFGIFKKEE